uniref:VWFA domain-containing protein n=1 Tax=Acrobeloides nanus TaxID=290746 RepID=A0A914EC80_9BILA
MIFGLHKVVRDANMELVELHQLAHYYFEEVWFMESDIVDIQSVDRRSYSLCSELPNNYEYPCIRKDKKNSSNCRTLSLIVTLGLDESKTTYRDLEETKEFLRKISQTCNPSQTKLSIFMFGATGAHISCQAGSEECEKAISGLTLEAATYKVGGLGYYGSSDRKYSALLQRMALKNGFKILDTVKEGLKNYDISTWIVITNFACDSSDRLYQLIQKEAKKNNIVENTIQRKDYEFLTMLKQHHILARTIMINQPSSSQSCLSDSPLEIAQEYVKVYELNENSNITLNNLIDDDSFQICKINQLDLPTNTQSKVLSLDTLVIVL